jgi:hypothetical protein
MTKGDVEGRRNHGEVNLVATITCPRCGHRAIETMPTNVCQFFYDCKGCKALLRPKAGDCCVFCSYGDRLCPPKQADGQGGCE